MSAIPVLDLGKIEAMVSDWVETEGVVGVVAAVASLGRTPSIAKAGWSDREGGKSISRTESFRIGSITKVFTAVLILDLVEDGLIGLEDPVADYVAGADPGMTIAHLLSHTSGLPDLDVSGGVLGAIMDPSSVLAPGEVIEQALRQGVGSEPGTQQSYSSTNYLILGDIVETATGQSYESALRARILDPLGLENTGFEQDDTNLATPYERPGPGQPKLSLEEFPTDVAVRASWAAGGLGSTVDDLVDLHRGPFRWTGLVIGQRRPDDRYDQPPHARDTAWTCQATRWQTKPSTGTTDVPSDWPPASATIPPQESPSLYS